jgi:hypothetical protein
VVEDGARKDLEDVRRHLCGARRNKRVLRPGVELTAIQVS